MPSQRVCVSVEGGGGSFKSWSDVFLATKATTKNKLSKCCIPIYGTGRFIKYNHKRSAQ